MPTSLRYAPRAILALAALSIAPLQAHAQVEALISGFYSSEPNCASGHQPSSEEHSYLHADGVDEFEGGCFFLQRYAEEQLSGARADELAGFVAVGFCQEPGFTTPHVFHVRRFAELPDGRHTLKLVYQDAGQTIDAEFYPCEGAK